MDRWLQFTVVTLLSLAVAISILKGVADMAISVEYVEIKDGPNREALFDALKYAYDKNNRHRVAFKGGYFSNGGSQVSTRASVEMIITGLKHDDGSGNSFTLEGYATNWPQFPHIIKFYFNTGNRTGMLRLTPLS
ncbi:MAG: hypothetical protein ABI397_00700 [Candidatus Saccharimonas sp.]